MKESMTRPYLLAKKLSYLFDLECNLDTALSVSMYYLNQFLESERTSVFLFEPWRQELAIFSSLDLKRQEVRISKSCGVAGWVFENRKPAIVHNAYEDSRFCSDVDKMTGFRTRNLICTPLVNGKGYCLGTVQSLNRKKYDYSADDLDLLNLASRMLAVAIKNNMRYHEVLVTNEARRKFINRIITPQLQNLPAV